MLGTPDAYLLPSLPGLGYLKVDTSHYERFRAALSSAPAPARPVVAPRRRRCASSTPPARARRAEVGRAPAPRRAARASCRCSSTASPAGREPVHQVWVAPLPEAEPLDAVLDARRRSGARRRRARAGAARPPRPARRAAHRAVHARPRRRRRPRRDRRRPADRQEHAAAHAGRVADPRATRPAQACSSTAIDLGGGAARRRSPAPRTSAASPASSTARRSRASCASCATEVEDREDALPRAPAGRRMRDARATAGALPGPRPARSTAGRRSSASSRASTARSRSSPRRPELRRPPRRRAPTAGPRSARRCSTTSARGSSCASTTRSTRSSRAQAAVALPADVPGRGLTMGGLHFQVALPRVDGRADDEGRRRARRARRRGRRALDRAARAEPIRLLPRLLDAAPSCRRRRRARACRSASRSAGSSPCGSTCSAATRTSSCSATPRAASPRCCAGWPHGLIAVARARGAAARRRRRAPLAGRPRATTPHVLRLRGHAARPPQHAAAGAARELGARMAPADASPLAGAAWQRPRYVVLFDDYDLVAGPTGGPLAPLLDLLAVGRDVGLHVVLDAAASAAAPAAPTRPVFGRLRELGSPGVLLSGDPARGAAARRRARPQPAAARPRAARPARRAPTARSRPPSHRRPPAGAARLTYCTDAGAHEHDEHLSPSRSPARTAAWTSSCPTETPIAELIPTFVELSVDDAPIGASGSGPVWSVAPPGQQPLPLDRTLAQCGVADGTVLSLTELRSQAMAPPSPAQACPRRSSTRAAARRASGPRPRCPRRSAAAERVGDAVKAFFGYEDEAPIVESSEPAAPSKREVLTKPEQRAGRCERARASWRETDYLARLDRAIAAPRLTRCATIAVVSPKGGVGKTTMTVLLGSLLGARAARPHRRRRHQPRLRLARAHADARPPGLRRRPRRHPRAARPLGHRARPPSGARVRGPDGAAGADRPDAHGAARRGAPTAA